MTNQQAAWQLLEDLRSNQLEVIKKKNAASDFGKRGMVSPLLWRQYKAAKAVSAAPDSNQAMVDDSCS